MRFASLVASRISMRSILGELVHVHLLEHLEHGFAAHAGGELVVAVLLDELQVALLAEELAPRSSPVSLPSMTMYASQ